MQKILDGRERPELTLKRAGCGDFVQTHKFSA
jgi:hypothetical protein